MKHIKLIFLGVILAMFTLSSCTNEESIVQQETTSSPSARESMDVLQSHFDDNGHLDTDHNHTGSIYFDFGFDFVYPVTLSYNTGDTVTVNDFDALVDILMGMTDSVYIDGIQFPFDVSYYNQNTSSLTAITINNEGEFEAFLTSLNFYNEPCDFDNTDDNAVCIEIHHDEAYDEAHNGDSHDGDSHDGDSHDGDSHDGDEAHDNFVITFPNMSYAECAGFTQNDVVDCN